MVQATRVVTDGVVLCFENRIGERWQSCLSLPVGPVRRVQRRVNEPDGRWTWLLVRPDGVVVGHRHA
jgi:hypothetical protein